MADEWTPSARLEELCQDQRDSWRRGEKLRVETYIERHPELKSDEKLLVDLIYAEYLLREQHGESPAAAEYLERFPELAPKLRALFDVLEAIENDPSLSAPEHETTAFSKAIVPASAGPQDTVAVAEPKASHVAIGTREEKSPRVFGSYELIEEVARGGMGIVYKARQPKLDRIVALKMILPGHFDSESAVRRFQIEAEAAAKLDHPCVVPIFDVGEQDGRPYLCMAFIDGESLAERLALGAIPLFDAARIVRDVAEAVHHAHERGIVHRDLKPANILIDHSGRPRVTDFGLARRFDVPTALSLDGSIIGTPSYMSPEQASGRTASIGPACDIYSLGAVLFHLLTGRPPFSGNNALEIIRQVCEKPAPSARSLNASVPEALDAVCLTCLAKEPDQRYPTAAKVAEDLSRYLHGLSAATLIHEPPKRERPRGRLALRIGAALVIAVPVVWLASAMRGARTNQLAAVIQPGQDTGEPARTSGVSAVPAVPLTGEIAVIIGDGSKNGPRARLRFDQPGALPLRNGDRIKIEARTNRPAYLYLVWIDAAGTALPVYPWQPGHWDHPPVDKPTTSLVFPPLDSSDDEQGYKNEGSAGMETLVLLARDTPLPADVPLKNLLAGLPAQPLQKGPLLVWLEKGEQQANPLRTPNFGKTQPIYGRAFELKRLIEKRLKPHFGLIRAVSLANRGT